MAALLEAGAGPQPTTIPGSTALHLAERDGHLKAAAALVKAGACLDAMTPAGFTPLHLAAANQHSATARALVGAGANCDTRLPSGESPPFSAASRGHLGTLKALLRAKSNPLSTKTCLSSGKYLHFLPMDISAQNGHAEVVRELLQRLGVNDCGGESGGVDALREAAQAQYVDVMAAFFEAGVTDTGEALLGAAETGLEAAVKLLLQQKDS